MVDEIIVLFSDENVNIRHLLEVNCVCYCGEVDICIWGTIYSTSTLANKINS
jgi:hypothetical protein